MSAGRNKKWGSREAIAVILAVIAVIAAVVVVWGVAFGGWLSAENTSEPSPDAAAVAEESAAGQAQQESASLDVGATAENDEVAAANSSEAPSESQGQVESGQAAAQNEGIGSSSNGETPAPAKEIRVTLSIDSSRAHDYNKSYASSMGSFTLTLQEGASVYDALCSTNATVAGSSMYVKSINGLSEFDCGKNSGWLYFVDGAKPNISCGDYALHGGEVITWLYTCDYAADGL